MTDREAIERLKICERCSDCLTCAEHDEAIKLALSALEEREERAMNWISVDERLPEDINAEYLVCCDYHGNKHIEIHHGWNMHSVTHWMPLPELPKEEM